MWFKMLVSIVFISILKTSGAVDSNTYFVNNVTLLGSDQYSLYWNYTLTDITLKIVVKTTGWVGFGLSPNGGMPNSDLVIAYKNADGSTNFSNRYVGSSNGVPIMDSTQNWMMLYFQQENGFTTVAFTRKIQICNSVHSIDILPGTQSIIFAWGSSFSKNDIAYHGGNRSSTQLPLISSLNRKVVLNMSEIETYDFTVNATILPNSDTEYFCQMFQLPDDWIRTKRHLVKYETLVAPSNKKYVHHWLMYECSKSYEDIFLASNNSTPQPGACFTIGDSQSDTNWPNVDKYCMKISLGWAVGGSYVQTLPENMGYPLGGSRADFKYFFLQIHYDNSDNDPNVTDYSGIRLYVTKNYRPTEFGILTVGAISEVSALLMPPKTKMSFDFYCRNDCTKRLFTKTPNITVIATGPHTHLAGREVYTKLIRNGAEVDFLTNSKYYAFNYQYTQFLTQPVTIFPNDELKVTCVYNTSDRNNYTTGGPTTHNEMCLDFIWYYPKSNDLSACYQATSKTEWQQNFKRNVTADLFDDSLKIQQIYQNFFDSTNKTQACVVDDNYILNDFTPYKVKALSSNKVCPALVNGGPSRTKSNGYKVAFTVLLAISYLF